MSQGQSTHLTDVLMQQSTGLKSNMPTERPEAELLLALNEFNQYELFTGTGNGIQSIFSDGAGTSNVSFTTNQNDSNDLNGCFVYFDKENNSWKKAYAQANNAQNEHYTAQGFAIALSSTGLQITTSGKLLVPFKLTDYQGNFVTAGSYYYLCQDQANAGKIQSTIPSSGIKQIICQVVSINESSTMLLLLNDLSQVAEDILVTSGDGSKYLGDDGQYHNMMIAGLAGRTANCINNYEVLDIDFDNIEPGDDSYGYVKNGSITINNNIASNFTDTDFIISKYLVENYSQYSLRVRQKFNQVTTIEPIISAINSPNYIAIENGVLKLVLNGMSYLGNLTYQANTYYHFKATYNLSSGYMISSSVDGTNWTNEIAVYDEINYLDNLTLSLGILNDSNGVKATSGEIDLSNSGFDYINSSPVTTNYPLSNLTDKSVSTITVTLKGNGIIASGRPSLTNTLNGLEAKVDIKESTIIYKEGSDLAYDTNNGLVVGNYSEVTQKPIDQNLDTNALVYDRSSNYVYKYTIVYPNFLETQALFEENNNDTIVNLSNANATFHPNLFLNRNGFDFKLKLNSTGNLKLYRDLDVNNYSDTGLTEKVYNNVSGVNWNSFISDGNYTQGIKLSSMLGNTNTGTGSGSLYWSTNLSTSNDDNYTTYSYGNVSKCSPGFVYYSFIKPIRFSNIVMKTASSANYLPQQFCIHVSNDLNTWQSILHIEDLSNVTNNGMFGNLPIDQYADFPITTVNTRSSIKVDMPDNSTYFKYVRVGFTGKDAYKPYIRELFIGADLNESAETILKQTATELILDKKNFINQENSGINAQVVRKKIGTSYQVRFLDKIGYTSIDPSQAIIDSSGAQLLQNNAQVYSDFKLQNTLGTQLLAYQVQCKRYLELDRDYCAPVAKNPFNLSTNYLQYSGIANSGSISTSYNLLQSNTSTYDFANALESSDFIITFVNKSIVDHFYIQNHTTANYNPQSIKIYGSIKGGFTENTGDESSDINKLDNAIWEEIPIYKIVQIYDGNLTHYSIDNPNTYCYTANITNPLSGTATATNYGAYSIYIKANKAYQQYKVSVQRETNNRTILMTVQPRGILASPFESFENTSNTLRSILVEQPYYPSSNLTTLPLKTRVNFGIYASAINTSTVFNLYNTLNATWSTDNSRYTVLQQVFKYPVNMNNVRIINASDFVTETVNYFEYYATNLDYLGIYSISNTNSLYNWSRLTSLNSKSDMPTVLSDSQQNSNVILGKNEYGFCYFTALLANRITKASLIYFGPQLITVGDYINNTQNLQNASRYVEEWKWTNVEGNKGDIRSGACYNTPLLQTGDTSPLHGTSYIVSKRNDTTKYYTSIEGQKDYSLPNNTEVYIDSSRLSSMTMPYENRWMYHFTDSTGTNWYSPSQPVDDTAAMGAKMYKTIIPIYNKDYRTGIPLTATVNSGSANQYTYFASSENEAAYAAWTAFSESNSGLWGSASSKYTQATGLPTGDPEYVGFRSPEPLCIQGYTIGARTATYSTPLKWEFQASNDGSNWVTLDTRDTEAETNPDSPINTDAGTTYYFDNEDSYSYYRWVIQKVQAASKVTYCLLKVKGLFVLEENPLTASGSYKLTYTNASGQVQTAYTVNVGQTGSYINNGDTIYKDRLQQEPIINTWAYQVKKGDTLGYTKVAGDTDSYVPETTIIYNNQDFDEEVENALVDSWQYTGDINKKYSYTGKYETEFTWDGQEPYNKYFYTGETANDYIYTGKIEGWKYTGIQEDIYDDSHPYIKLTLNRDNVRRAVKTTTDHIAFPVTNASNISGIQSYSYTFGDIAGSIVPEGTPLYSDINDTIPSAYADGSNNYVFSSATPQNVYNYAYVYTRANNYPDNTALAEDTEAYYDTNLVNKVDNEQINLTQYYYENNYSNSKIAEFYHKITETVPVDNYNFNLAFNSESGYTYTTYADGGTVDTQTSSSTDSIKSSYTGADEQTRENSVIIMKSQDLFKLNLSKSEYSWWSWNNLINNSIQQTQASLFRIGEILTVNNKIEAINKLYPWRVDDIKKSSNIYAYDSSKNRYSMVDKTTILPYNMLGTTTKIPENSQVLYGIPNFYFGYSYNSFDSFTGSKSFNDGGVIYSTTTQNVTVSQGGNPAMTFNGFIGVLPIPPNTTVTVSNSVYYSEF